MSQRIVGEYGTSLIAKSDKPENPDLWKPKELTDAELLKKKKWSAEQLSTARTQLGFPSGVVYTSLPPGEWGVKRVTKTKLEDIERWEAFARSLGLMK